MTAGQWLSAVLLLALLASCGSASGSQEPSIPAATPGATLTIDLGDRPFQLRVPESYAPDRPVPLVVLLHGYTTSAAEQEAYFQLAAESDRRGFLYAMPDGTVDPAGDRFWNATDVCCDRYDSGIDDSAYLRELIDLLTSSYPVDSARVWLVGHSNGGYMAHRMACDHADAVGAIVSVAGLPYKNRHKCEPDRPVDVLQIHGTADETVPFGGTSYDPSAEDTVQMWRDLDGCADRAEPGEPLDLEAELPGAETTVTGYAAGCRDGTRVQLWTIDEGVHVPELTTEFAPAVLDFLYAQTRP